MGATTYYVPEHATALIEELKALYEALDDAKELNPVTVCHARGADMRQRIEELVHGVRTIYSRQR